MSPRKTLSDGTLITKVSLYSLGFPGLHSWPLAQRSARPIFHFSQETSADPMTFQKGYSKETSIFPCNLITTSLPLMQRVYFL